MNPETSDTEFVLITSCITKVILSPTETMFGLDIFCTVVIISATDPDCKETVPRLNCEVETVMKPETSATELVKILS